jgi:hypothetical protein
MIQPDLTQLRFVFDVRAALQKVDVITEDGAEQIPIAAFILECTRPGLGIEEVTKPNFPGADHALAFNLPLESVAGLIAVLRLVLDEAMRDGFLN